MRSFDQLIGLLREIPDPRRAEGKLYQLPYVLLFSILAVVTGVSMLAGREMVEDSRRVGLSLRRHPMGFLP